MATNVTNNASTQSGQAVPQTKQKCAICGKYITTPGACAQNTGTLCYKYANKYGAAALAQLHTSKVVQNTQGLLKTAQLHKVCQQLGISIAAMVNAFGGDRGLQTAKLPCLAFVYNQANHRFITTAAFTIYALQTLTATKLTPAMVLAANTKVLGKVTAQAIAKLPQNYCQITPAAFIANNFSYVQPTTNATTTTTNA